MERSKKILSLLEECSDSEDKKMIQEMHQELEQRQLEKSGGNIRRKGETKQ